MQAVMPGAARPTAYPTSRKANGSPQGDGSSPAHLVGGVQAPPPPRSLAESGLSLGFISDLTLKLLLLQGSSVGIDLARQLCLPFKVFDEAITFLKDNKLIEVVSGQVIGRVSYRFELTDLGRARARDALAQCRYVGPAPVPLADYTVQTYQQSVTGTHCDLQSLREAFEHLVVPEDLLTQLGPAICSGKSIFVYGPPGNGKTVVAHGLGNFLNSRGGEVYVPYAFLTESSVVTVLDPSLHEIVQPPEKQAERAAQDDPSANWLLDKQRDERWVRIRRPVVVAGGELTLEMLDLRYQAASNYYQAPLHIKANGGVFLIDDFGRQIVSPRDLLNRWILPLEERRDHLTLATGLKFAIPFEQLIIFSTNLEPRDLVDEAFLRRIRHKIQIRGPTREHYTAIFQLVCRRLHLSYVEEAVDYLYGAHYDQGMLPRASDPRDLLEIVQSICRFRQQPAHLSRDLIAEAAKRFFYQL